MIDSITRAGASSAERFERVGVPADPRMAAQTRDEFSRWLNGALDLDAYRASDLLLATYEALANTAEFAYPSTGFLGTMDVSAIRSDPGDADRNRCRSRFVADRTVDPARSHSWPRNCAHEGVVRPRVDPDVHRRNDGPPGVDRDRTRFLPDRDDTPSGQ